MKRLIAIAAITITLNVPANALNDTGFQEAALKCWNRPAGAEYVRSFVMSVEIDAKGEIVDATVKKYKRDGTQRAIGESLKRAILRCTPYKFPAGTYTITIDDDKTDGKSLNIWKE